MLLAHREADGNSVSLANSVVRRDCYVGQGCTLVRTDMIGTDSNRSFKHTDPGNYMVLYTLPSCKHVYITHAKFKHLMYDLEGHLAACPVSVDYQNFQYH